jgi:hypothetical protein
MHRSQAAGKNDAPLPLGDGVIRIKLGGKPSADRGYSLFVLRFRGLHIVAGIAAMGVAAVLGMVMDLNNTAVFTSSCVAYVAVSMWTESRIARYRNREQPTREQLVSEQPGEQRVSEQRVSEQRPLESRGGEQPSGDQRPRGEGNAA